MQRYTKLFKALRVLLDEATKTIKALSAFLVELAFLVSLVIVLIGVVANH